MADYTGGYTSALNDGSRRDSEAVQRRALLQALAEQQQLFQQQQQERQRQMQGRRVIEQLLPQLAQLGAPPGADGAQPPPPGQSSGPMMPPPPPQAGAQGPPQGAPPGGPPQGGPGNIDPAMLRRFLTMMPPPQQGGGMPSPPPATPGTPAGPGAPTVKSAGPGAPPAGPPGAAPMGAGPQMGPQPWKALPTPPAPAPGAPGGLPPPPEDAVMPRQQLSVGELAKFLNSKGIKGEEALAAIEQWKPYMDSQNKAELDALKLKYQAQTAAVKAYQAVLRDAEHARHNTAEEGIQRDRNAAMRARDAARGRGKEAPKPTWSQSTIDYYAAKQLGGDGTWRTGLSRTAQGATNISAVDDRVAELSAERGSNATTDLANVATRKATEKALTERTKFVAAGQQFVRNFQKQADLVEKYLETGAAGSVPVINKWIQKGRKGVQGDADVTAFDTAIRGLAREHQRIVTGVTSNAQLHVSAQETADELLNKDMTPDQVRGTLKVMREEADNAVASGQEEVGALKTELKNIGAGDEVREFKTEAEALSAKLKPGTKVKINGRSATIE